jgi:hypothetical protein
MSFLVAVVLSLPLLIDIVLACAAAIAVIRAVSFVVSSAGAVVSARTRCLVIRVRVSRTTLLGTLTAAIARPTGLESACRKKTDIGGKTAVQQTRMLRVF